MIDVTLKEDTRRYELKIGQKMVGRVTVYNPDYIEAEVWNSDTSEWEGFDYFPSLRHASNATLRKLGYGNATAVTIDRFKGLRSR